MQCIVTRLVILALIMTNFALLFSAAAQRPNASGTRSLGHVATTASPLCTGGRGCNSWL
jgi:hypothetical protein